MSTHTTPHLDRKVLLALVPLASLAASHEGNPNAHGPVNFSEIAESITAATTSTTQPTSAIETSRSSSHSTHLTPSLLHGIIPSVTTTASTSPSPLGADQTRTQTVWANVAQVTEVVTIVKTLTPDHETTSPTSTTNAITTSTASKSTSTSTSTDTDPLVIIPVTATVTDLINYNTYTAPASLPPLPPLLPPPGPRVSASSKSSSSPSISDDGPLEIIPVTGTVTDLVDYETVMVPSATATTVVVIPVSSSSTTKSQDVGQMLGQIQGMGEQSSRVVVHPTVSVGDRLTVVVSGGDGRTTITRASPMASAGSAMKGEGGGGKFCKEE
ncbi:hypothetical protein NEUTE1DRAFT_124939 [Neurospora tetrasperma FGSC 2508]|uniref:Uncharacterized protein n=1 Tax=Neurospora tetrasperma (strain FGSC 2508 / ATCC MYA-4615 / P0657) TaxID=510951 RepID=F8MVL7_NEUT8|nr:uncharacterized protein NEUTE1DRAFT_124939 [Neurospora tetrasperma FGSC 2508]EGO54768.1 hypothetical protein NEUTE1DRAFT_124939 [Neurospora tetrasperma FGSC 2508]